MRTHTLVARITNAWRAIVNPTSTTIEHELSQDRAPFDPDEVNPTKGQIEASRSAAIGLEWRVRKASRRRENMSAQLQAAKAGADAADKALVDLASSPVVAEVRTRAATLRTNHPLREERTSFRAVHLPKWMRVAIECIIIIADWGVWFTLLTIGTGLSFTKMAGPTDPTKIYNPDWFIAHPTEWITAFVVPTFAALFTLAVGKLAARRWAQYAAQSDHSERAGEIGAPISRKERRRWAAALVLLGIGLYLVAAMTFGEFADSLAWLIAAPWAVIPLSVFLVERYGQDPIADVDALILLPAARIEQQKEECTAALMRAEDAWRAVWTKYDGLLREIIDGASGDLNLFEQLMMRAHARTGLGRPLAPIGVGAAPVTGRGIASPAVSAETPSRPTPVVLEAQRGLVTRVAPWITKQIELDLQLLNDCRPPIDSAAERTARITQRFEHAYAAAQGEQSPSGAAATTGSNIDSNPGTSEADTSLTPGELGDDAWSRLAAEAARP